ncbi:MAG TPA: hypothetical protein VGD94_12795 [Vicinamibacterales bacterium]
MPTLPTWTKFLKLPFVRATRDPALIDGIYNTCDQWCMYCPATDRCLAYRCQPEATEDSPSGSIYENIAHRLFEGMQMLRELNAAEGRTIPELEALLADDPRRSPPALEPVNDPLEKMGRRYAVLSSRYLQSHPAFPFEMRPRAEGPTPFEVFSWYHVLIAAKINRAITSHAAGVRSGDQALRMDALFSAKTALIGIERSRTALTQLQAEDEDVRLEEMQRQLARLARELAARFPEAKSIVRPGLDESGR